MQLSAAATSASLLLASNVFAILYKQLKRDYLWASLCIMGAVYSIFRG